MAYNNQENRYTYITEATTTQVATGKGILHSIIVNETVAGTLKVIDGTSGATANIATLKASIVEGTYLFDVTFSAGLRIVSGAAGKYTITWSQA